LAEQLIRTLNLYGRPRDGKTAIADCRSDSTSGRRRGYTNTDAYANPNRSYTNTHQKLLVTVA
jgi:hypothetical protein